MTLFLLLLGMVSISSPSESGEPVDCEDGLAAQLPKDIVRKFQKKLQKRLFKAAKAGDVQEIAELLCSGVDINVNYRPFWFDGREDVQPAWTALMLASGNGHADAVEFLLKRGAKVDARALMSRVFISNYPSSEMRPDSRTALMLASKEGHPRVVTILLEYGADPNLSDWLGRTALIMASQESELEVARLLLDHGADVNARTEMYPGRVKYPARAGKTALMFASQSNHPEVVALLLAHPGIDVNQASQSGETALDVARGRETKSVLVQAGAKRGEDLDVQ